MIKCIVAITKGIINRVKNLKYLDKVMQNDVTSRE